MAVNIELELVSLGNRGHGGTADHRGGGVGDALLIVVCLDEGPLVERLDLPAVVVGDDAHASTLGERRHDLAG